MSQSQQNEKTEYKNPFLIMSEYNAVMNDLRSAEEEYQFREEENSGSFWDNLMHFKKPKSSHDRLKEVYQDVKRMADRYLDKESPQVTVKKFIV